MSSNVYVLVPPTNGKVILHTDIGELEIELWGKECPKTVRNFLQLCMEGYYDNCEFHRVVRDFMVQTGDPAGDGGLSVFADGKPFHDEFHSRLRFDRRGLLGMASHGPNTNQSQFFITMAPCEWLTKKHTMFGKVVGDTIYNAIKLQNGQLGDNDRPLHPHKIIRTEIIVNPFEGIVPRTTPEARAHEQKQRQDAIAAKNKRKLSKSKRVKRAKK